MRHLRAHASVVVCPAAAVFESLVASLGNKIAGRPTKRTLSLFVRNGLPQAAGKVHELPEQHRGRDGAKDSEKRELDTQREAPVAFFNAPAEVTPPIIYLYHYKTTSN